MLHIRLLEDRRLDVRGEDAREWLQGQLTCDLSEVSPGSAIYGLLLSPKGKLMSDVWVLEHPADAESQYFSLCLPADRAEAAHDRLDRFLVMEDVELEFSEEVAVSLQGVGADAALAEAGIGAEKRWPVARIDVEGAEVWLDEASAEALLTTLGATDAVRFEDARIDAGVAAIGIDMGEDTLPQEAGMHGAVSFTKGCYVGQEPVVMLEHRGKPPKRLVRLRVEGAAVGDVVMSGERKVGRVTSVHSAEALALALVKRKHLEDTLSVGSATVSELRVIDNAMPGART